MQLVIIVLLDITAMLMAVRNAMRALLDTIVVAMAVITVMSAIVDRIQTYLVPRSAHCVLLSPTNLMTEAIFVIRVLQLFILVRPAARMEQQEETTL